ncbi:MAG: hypothetical protein KC635_15230 [Myxococcales bacterium]|nr:hypothetical protein [Myxococcales bacterium]MCB9735180.1 hypothetical protein [Deltaproteobacteria bacterium]
MNGRRHLILGALIGALTGGAFFIGGPALSNLDDDAASLDCVVAYDGKLSLAGVPFTDDVDLRFTLYDDGGASMWQETHSGVAVDDDGAFNVLLGSSTSLASVIADAETLYIGVEVKRHSGGSYTALAGKQLLATLPFAIRSTQGVDMAVGGQGTAAEAMVYGDVTLKDDLFMRSPTGHLSIGAGVSGRRGVVFGDSSKLAQMVYDSGTNALSFENANDLSDATDLFTIDADDAAVAAAGALTAKGDLEVAGDLTITPATKAVTIDGGNLLIGQSSSRAMIVFGDDTNGQGIQMVYDPPNNDFIFEAGSDYSDGADVLSTDVSTKITTISGTLSVSNNTVLPVTTQAASTSVRDNNLQKRFWADTGCNNGSIAAGFWDFGSGSSSTNRVAICVCFDTDTQTQVTNHGKGWFCWY